MLEFVYKHFCRRFKAYQSFESKEALNDSVRLFTSEHHMELTDASRKVLKLIAAKSCNGVIGASWMKIETIADKTGISVSSVERSVRFFVGAGFLKKFYEKRNGGGRIVVLVIQPYQGHNFFADDDGLNDGLDDGLQPTQKQPESPSVARDSADDKKRHSFSFNSNLQNKDLKDLNVKQTQNSSHLNFSHSEETEKFIARNVPEYFKQAIRTLVDAKTLNTLWKRTLICMRECRAKFVLTDIVEEAWLITYKMIKHKQMQGTDAIGLYYGVLRKLYRDFEFQIQSEPEMYSQYFYTHKQKRGYRSKFADHTRCITKHAQKMIDALMRFHKISYEDARNMWFAK